MSLPSLLSRWRADPTIGANVVEWHSLPARAARFEPIPNDVHPALAEALRGQGIPSLYRHQSISWLHAKNRQNVAVVTPTASGKTLCYNLPVLDGLLRENSARALYLFPTKALAQDQLSSLKNLLCAAEPDAGPLQSAIYDGDTASHLRPKIRAEARLLLSNPDMLHTGILPHHTAWAEFFRGLRFVVLDELHTYRGVFGSHVANVLRRLNRIARHYGASPQFLMASATIANPQELAEWLIEAPVRVIGEDEDGAARGARHYLLYNPPIVDKSLGIRRSAGAEAIRLAEDLVSAGVQTILFGQSRRGVEILLKELRERLPEAGVRAYRSGYLPSERRDIERGLRDGIVQLVVATNALELGIDIGGMGAAVLAGYPGTIASARQQMGRAGRGAQASLAALVVSANPLDQYLAHHPEFFFGRSPEQALIAPDHLLILLGHLRCAAFELPFKPGDSFGKLDPQRLRDFLEFLTESGDIHASGGRYYWMSELYPAQGISLRAASAENVLLQCAGKTIGQVDAPSAAWMVHPGAIYLHEGQAYVVEALDLEEGRALLKEYFGDEITQPRRETTLALIQPQGQAQTPGGYKAHGEITVTTQVLGYQREKWGSRERLGFEPLDLPPFTLQTTGYWLCLDDETVSRLDAAGLWNNTPNDYGPGWPALARQVRTRDGFVCQSCGAPENNRAHDVHHLVPFRTFASPQEANRPENLVTLCPSCHRQAEQAVRIRSGLAGVGYVVWQLAPLFLMCDAGDLGLSSDPQSPLAEGKPAVTLYDQVPAGIGFSARLYDLHTELTRRAFEVVGACACEDGCPSCVGPGGGNGYGGKNEALAILKALNDPV
jgi:DEAD/DEAH box helicase domain-containing protein